MKPILDLSSCDREPVNFIGRTQTFGALIVVESSSQKVIQVSKNLDQFLAIDPAKILGQKSFQSSS